MKAHLLAVSTAIHEFFMLHPGVLEAKKRLPVLSSGFCSGSKEATNAKFIRDASSLISRICGYLVVEEKNILRNRDQLTRSQSLYIRILQGFRDLDQRLKDKINIISVSRFIDLLTILEIEVRKAVATFDAAIISEPRMVEIEAKKEAKKISNQSISESQRTSRRNTPSPIFSLNDSDDSDLALTIFDPSAGPTLKRKVSWKENIAEEHAIPSNPRIRWF